MPTDRNETNEWQRGVAEFQAWRRNRERALTEAMPLITRKMPEIRNPHDIPLDGADVFEHLSKELHASSFALNLEKQAIDPLLDAISPRNLDGLTLLLPLAEPAFWSSGASREFIARTQGGEQPASLISQEIAPMLEETHGLLIFEDQAISILTTLAGCSEEKSGPWLHALRCKHPRQLAQCEALFVERARQRQGMPSHRAKALFAWLEQSAGPMRRRWHVREIATLICRTVWLGIHVPEARTI